MQKIIFFLIFSYLSASAQAELSNSSAYSPDSKQNLLKNNGYKESAADNRLGEDVSETGHQKLALNDPKLALNEQGEPIFDLSKMYGIGAKELVDFSGFGKGAEGEYRVDIFLNGESLASVNTEFKSIKGDLIPCFTKNLLSSLNVDFSTLSAENLIALEKVEQGACIPLKDIISGASANFELSKLELFVSIPQAFLKKVPRGYVNPELWDKGVNAATLKYRLNHYRTTGDSKHNSSYAMIQAGLNVNGWGFKHFGNFTQSSYSGSTYNSINTYVERALPSIGSKLTIGDSYTDGAVSNSLSIRGVQLKSSDLMLPVSMRGYSPVVRGFALTNAKVEIFQNGTLIYETTVSPGPFVIDDLYQSASNADLNVVITEADGSTSNFIVPNSSMPQLVRGGQFRYSVAAGKLRDFGVTTKTNVIKATGQYGLSNSWTAYGGVTLSKDYWATLLGSVYDTKFGAFSGDVEFSNAKVKNFTDTEKFNGRRARIGYAQMFDLTKSSINISVYSFDKNYLDIASAVERSDFYRNYSSRTLRERRRAQISYSQPLGKYGNFYATASTSKYWNDSGSNLTAQAGFSKSFRINNFDFDLNLSYSKTKSNDFKNNELIALMLSFPLDTRYVRNVTTTVAHDNEKGYSEQIRFNGDINDRLNYGLYADHSKGQSIMSGGNLYYRTSAAIFEGSASTYTGTSQISASVSGGVVMHSGGITFANTLGDTMGLIYAPGAKNATVQNSQGIEVDSNGYAVAPYLNAYERNNVLLDTEKVSTDVNFASTTEQAIPYEGAIVALNYETAIGKSVLFDITRDDGTPPPFGSVAVLPDGKEVGVVGQGGSAFVYGLAEKGAFDVKWGDGPGKKCAVRYELDNFSTENNAYAKKSVECVLPSESEIRISNVS